MTEEFSVCHGSGFYSLVKMNKLLSLILHVVFTQKKQDNFGKSQPEAWNHFEVVSKNACWYLSLRNENITGLVFFKYGSLPILGKHQRNLLEKFKDKLTVNSFSLGQYG